MVLKYQGTSDHMLGIDHQSLLGFLAHSCTHYTANDSPHPPHSVSFSQIYPSYTKSLLVSPITDDISFRGWEGGGPLVVLRGSSYLELGNPRPGVRFNLLTMIYSLRVIAAQISKTNWNLVVILSKRQGLLLENILILTCLAGGWRRGRSWRWGRRGWRGRGWRGPSGPPQGSPGISPVAACCQLSWKGKEENLGGELGSSM